MSPEGKLHYGEILENHELPTKRLMTCVPLTGLIRAEWALARYGQAIPCNWSMKDVTIWLDQCSPMRYSVADARNICADIAIKEEFEWVFFIDHDVLLPPGTLIKLNQYMNSREYPIVNGLYFTRSRPSEPLVYRGRGNSYYSGWKIGEKVFASGTGLGCTLIHVSILKEMWKCSPEYVARGQKIKSIFKTPSKNWFDSDVGATSSLTGTEDIHFYHRLKSEGIYAKAGWPEVQRLKYPLMIDTSIFCRHIDPSGIQYPAMGEEFEFVPKEFSKKKV